MTPEEHRDQIWAILHAMAEREKQTEIRFNQRMEKADQRMEKAEKRADRADERADRADERMDRAEQRMDRSDQRLDKIEHQLQVTSKLVQAGIKLVQDIARRQKAAEIETAELKQGMRELQKSQKAFMDWWRRGNGNGRGHNGSGKK